MGDINNNFIFDSIFTHGKLKSIRRITMEEYNLPRGKYSPLKEKPNVKESITECDQCGGNGSEESHICPFQDEIYRNKSECNCCEDCEIDCNMAI